MPGTRCKILLVGLFLSACAHQTPAIKVEYVDRPVVTERKCFKPADIPDRPAPLSKTAPPTNLETALAVSLAKVSEWVRYGNKSDILLKSCTD